MSKAWGGRFKEEMAQQVLAFNESITVDKRLYAQDIEGSIAHAMMLCQQSILSQTDADTIIEGLLTIKQQIESGNAQFSIEDEDIHMNIEKLLIKIIGPVGGKLHTGRSRNDQVATDMHLFARQAVQELIEAVRLLQQTIVQISEEYIEVVMPGYTHLQRAQPVLLSHHLMTYFWMLQRDKERLHDSLKRINVSPLGSGALAGTTFPINQRHTMELLEFEDIYPNSMDAVSDRDYLLETMNNMNLIMIHLSRLSEEIILWCSEEFNFIKLSDQYSTGSSIMPQKKNPDMAELVRGKTGSVTGHYIALLITLKGLPLAYNKDLQEDKKGFFDALDDTLSSLKIYSGMLSSLTVNHDNLKQSVNQDFSNATELADYLVTLGIPFREAHAITGRLVLDCIDKGRLLKDVSMKEYKDIDSRISENIHSILTPQSSVERRRNENGTSAQSVKNQIKKGKALL
ncbi:argininosuccinate lyase [Macrococcus lamae]|uniref:Argininosuccinate lyase n=1 Tax=Macrococcus lamae TaxID=198484 RepID=A0A4R6BW09_9STAP|nr:argininosuccinate lyase [Macrococcus lamae]TDM12518.1 argininosuccinate lyase [Macrococcus lamae]